MRGKIVIVINSLRGGGAERVVAYLSSYLLDRKQQVTVVTLHDSSDDFYHLTNGVKRHSLGGARGVLPMLIALRKILKSEQADYVLGMMTVPSILVLIASWGLGIKTVISERNHPPRKPTPARWRVLRSVFYRSSHKAVVLTEETATWMRRAGCKKVNVIPVSVKLPLPELQPLVPVADFLSSDDFLFLAVGRLDFQKGFDLLIRSFSTLAGQNSDMKLMILGEGGERDRLETLIQELGLAGRVYMPGRAGNISEWYARAQVFVFSSRFEGFGNVLVEAMASGCACVSFDCDVGPRDAIEHGVDGILVEPEDVDALAARLSELYCDAPLRDRLSRNARIKGKQFYEEVIMQRWCEVFDD